MKISKLIQAFFIAAVLINDVISLQCYDCSSDALPGCSDPFSPNTIPVVTCEGESGSACFKLVTTSSTNVKKTFRGCSAMGTCNTQNCIGLKSYSSVTNFCTSDKCNSGTKLKHETSALLFCSLLLFKILFH